MLDKEHIGVQCEHVMQFFETKGSCSTCSAVWRLGPYGWHPVNTGKNLVKGHERESLFWRAIKGGVPVKKKKGEDEFYDD